jgi:hypothetical protein
LYFNLSGGIPFSARKLTTATALFSDNT